MVTILEGNRPRFPVRKLEWRVMIHGDWGQSPSKAIYIANEISYISSFYLHRLCHSLRQFTYRHRFF